MTVPATTAALLRRIVAFASDYLAIAAWLVLVVGAGALLRLAAPELATAVFTDPLTAQAAGFVLLTLPVSLYFALSEAAESGATWGKRRMRLRAVTENGQRLTLWRSIARTALKFVPWELSHAIIWRFANPGSAPDAVLNAGLVLVWVLIGANLVSALLDPERRTIYDRLSGTRVVVA